MILPRHIVAVLFGIAAAAAAGAGVAAQESGFAVSRSAGPVTGFPLPRFVSLKSDQVNVRRGPSRGHGVLWIYKRKRLPVEIIAEFENWRRIRDQDGAVGWVFHSLLDGRRTAVFMGAADDLHALAERPGSGETVALAETGVVAEVDRCEDGWCALSAGGHSGWVEDERLWGVYPGETVGD